MKLNLQKKDVQLCLFILTSYVLEKEIGGQVEQQTW